MASSIASVASCWLTSGTLRTGEFGPVVPASGQLPCSIGGGLELREVQLPDLSRARRLLHDGRLVSLGQPAAFALVAVGFALIAVGKDRHIIAKQPQHGRVVHRMPS